MSTERSTQDLVERWLVDGFGSAPDIEHLLRDVHTVVASTPQRRHHWWPLPSLPRRTAQPSGIPGKEPQQTSITTTNGHAVATRFMPMFSATKVVIAGVIVALAGGFLLIAQPFEQEGASVPGAATARPGAFSPSGSLAQPRAQHTATLLPDGRVLVVGGCCIVDDDEQGLAIDAAEVYDPASATFSAAGSLIGARRGHTATGLPDGRVLIVGGTEGSATNWVGSASADVWDPATAAFEPVGDLAEARLGHTATALLDGRVLIVGGYGPDGLVGSAEVYDPATATFSAAGSLAEPRQWHTATRLPDGRVLVVGGTRTMSSGSGLTSAEVWDPATASFEAAGSLATKRARHSATLLRDGRVLVVGGADGGYGYRSAEVWDPATASFEAAGSLAEGRDKHTATLLRDGRVLIVGDSHELRPNPAAEVWDPATASFSPAGSLARGRVYGTATPLLDGRVLVVGGFSGVDFGGTPPALAEVWAPTDG